MSEYIPSVQLRTGSSTIAADFIAHIDTTLTIESLVARFSEALGLQAASHACYRVENGTRRFLFGETGWCGPVARLETLTLLSFPITGWDEIQYEVEFRLFSMLETGERANLHAMSVLYLCRGIALLDAQDDSAESTLTTNERFCVEKRQAGWCDLDIADALDRSVHAVKIHVQRARLKQDA